MSKNKTVPIEALDGVPFMLVESDGNAEVADFLEEYNYSPEYLVQDVGRLCDYVDGQERAWSQYWDCRNSDCSRLEPHHD